MRLVRWLLIAIGILLLALSAAAALARLGDGPTAIFPGGPLVAGELVKGPEPDWSFARDIPEMEFQLVEPPRSRTIWLLVHERELYIVSGYMNTPVGRYWKHWPLEAERDGRALIRIDGKRYERQVVRLRDRALIEALADEAHRKYDVPLSPDVAESGDAWFYQLVPRSAASG